MNKNWIPEIMYEDDEHGMTSKLPFIMVPEKEEMPKVQENNISILVFGFILHDRQDSICILVHLCSNKDRFRKG